MREWSKNLLLLIGSVVIVFLLKSGLTLRSTAPEAAPAPAVAINEIRAKRGAEKIELVIPLDQGQAPSSPRGTRKRALAGEKLFDYVYSDAFQNQGGWRKQRHAILARLGAPYPAVEPKSKNEHDTAIDREIISRIGLLKGLQTVSLTQESATELKETIQKLLLSGEQIPWTVSREAMRILLRPEIMLSEAGREKIVSSLDPRTRSLAGRSDEQILDDVIKEMESREKR